MFIEDVLKAKRKLTIVKLSINKYVVNEDKVGAVYVGPHEFCEQYVRNNSLRRGTNPQVSQ
jgi:hypothetical protein